MRTHTRPPPSTNGFRFPILGIQVLSLIAPIKGWISRPVIGPAMLRIGKLCASAPSSRKIGFTALWVSPKLNCTPKNPRFIQAMLPVVIRGRRTSSAAETSATLVAPVTIEPLLRENGSVRRRS